MSNQGECAAYHSINCECWRTSIEQAERALADARAQALADRAFQSDNARLRVQLAQAEQRVRAWDDVLALWAEWTRDGSKMQYKDFRDRMTALLTLPPAEEGEGR